MAPHPTTAVVGAGSWGTALARLLADHDVPTTLWAREAEVVSGIATQGRNPLFLSDVDLPAALRPTGDLAEALTGAHVVVNAVPTQHVQSVFAGHGDALRAAGVIVTASKGIEAGTLRLPHEILVEVGARPEQLVALSGPSFAKEVAAGMPTAVVAAGPDRERTLCVRSLFSAPSFRVYSVDDIVSVELGGALKNVIAIAAGIADGLGYGHNTRAAIITRGLAEITRLGVARGGDAATFAGLSGIGDLLLTCTGGLSRNRQVGVALGQGRTLEQITAEMHEVAEGVPTCRSARALGQQADVELPITEQVYLVLHEGKNPALAVADLTGRELRNEREHVWS